MVRAVFFDRDGTINHLVWHNNELGAPRSVEEIELVSNVEEVIKIIRKNYLIFVVSNQPDAAKGNISYDEMMEVINWFKSRFFGVVDKFYFCYHHPSRCKCLCRKPGTYFVEEAIQTFNINVGSSWFVGDREDTDVLCGKAVGLNTILVKNDYNPYELLNTIKFN